MRGARRYNLVVGGVLLWVIRDGLSDVWLIVELLVTGIAYATVLVTLPHPEQVTAGRSSLPLLSAVPIELAR